MATLAAATAPAPPEVFQNAARHSRILDESHPPHGPAAPDADEHVELPGPLHQPGPLQTTRAPGIVRTGDQVWRMIFGVPIASKLGAIAAHATQMS